jgi:hypothetical protein
MYLRRFDELMKNPRFALLTSFFLLTGSLCAQESSAVSEPTDSSATAAPAEPSVITAPPELFPEAPLPEPPKMGSTTSSRTRPKARQKKQSGSDEVATRIRFREARTKALSDPEVQRLQTLAESARSDADKREAYGAFYKALFAKIVRLDPMLKARAAEKEQESLAQLTPPRAERRNKASKAEPTPAAIAEHLRSSR